MAVLQASSVIPARSAVLANLQPVISIVAAYLLFGEVLTWLQSAGAVLVLGGIMLMQWSDLRRRA